MFKAVGVDHIAIAQISILLLDWEIWGSELLESHLSYPMLAYYRSQHQDQFWLAALTAIMGFSPLDELARPAVAAVLRLLSTGAEEPGRALPALGPARSTLAAGLSWSRP
jgi:hypothetical protein